MYLKNFVDTLINWTKFHSISSSVNVQFYRRIQKCFQRTTYTFKMFLRQEEEVEEEQQQQQLQQKQQQQQQQQQAYRGQNLKESLW